MIEEKKIYYKVTELLTFEQQMNLSREASLLFEFVWNRLNRREATEISILNSDAARRAKCRLENLERVQAEVQRGGLLWIEAIVNPRHAEYERRCLYIIPDQPTV